MSNFPKTERNEVRRVAKNSKYDRQTIYEILDENFVCHVGFSIGEQPFIIPTLYARIDDSIVIHGSHISRMLKNLSKGINVCITVTMVDGIVLARSAFHHSMNYRSVVAFGTGELVENEDERLHALYAISENILKDRWNDCREPNDKELNVTSVLKIKIEEASAKIREGDPIDDAKDYDLSYWAGVLPIETNFDKPIPDAKLDEGIKLPDYLKKY